jgi:hypothetical protein
MGLLRHRTIHYDPFVGDEAARDAAHWLEQGDWIPTMALLRDTEDCSLRMNMLTSEAVHLDAFHTWVDAHPTGLSLTMLAMRQKTVAWEIGRTKPGQYTQEEIDEAFRAQLRIADRTIAQACGNEPDLADAWAAAIPIATGLGLGIRSAVSRFERVQALHPYHHNACTSMLRANFRRWGGSDELMFDFARRVSAEVAPASALQSVLPIAHLEYVAAHGKGLSHFSRSENRDELTTVVKRFLEASPGGPAPPEQVEALNTFVRVLGHMYPLPDALLDECIHRIDGRATAVPWRRGHNDIAATYAAFLRKLDSLRSRAADAAKAHH